MKKNNFNSYLLFMLFIILPSFSTAQSDYAMVQKFKNDCSDIEKQIIDAKSLDDINIVKVNIEELRMQYSRHSELLDKAIYPDNFGKLTSKFNDLITMREADFNTVEDIKATVVDLNKTVDTLHTVNSEMQNSLKDIQTLFSKSRKENTRLSDIILELKIALHKRDVLVMNMVDSLMPPVMRERAILSSEDKEKIVSDVEKDNILLNVKTTIRDNIKYLDLTSLQPEDLAEIQKQQLDFSDTWARIGPRLAEVYSDNKNRSNDLYEIDSLFKSWTTAIRTEAWQSIKEDFNARGITLNDFSDGEEFQNSINQYIHNEKMNIDSVTHEEAKLSFEQFADQAWNSEIKPKWIPFLIDNRLLTENSEAVIEENIELWRSELYPSYWWIWIIILGFILAGLALLLKLLKKSAKYDNMLVN